MTLRERYNAGYSVLQWFSHCCAGSRKAAESHRGGAYGRAGGQASLLSDDENSGTYSTNCTQYQIRNWHTLTQDTMTHLLMVGLTVWMGLSMLQVCLTQQ